jgi:RHS repeat-associated protein
MFTTTGTGSATHENYENRFAWGGLFERGIGYGITTGSAEGNRVRTIYLQGSNASTALTPAYILHYDGSLGTTPLWEEVFGVDSFGRTTVTETLNGATFILRGERKFTIDPGGYSDRPSQIQDLITSPSTFASTNYQYQSAQWDAPSKVEEPSGEWSQYVYGGLGGANEEGRLQSTARSADGTNFTTLQQLTHTKDGLVSQNYSTQLSTAAGTYTYDNLRRLTKETRSTAGEQVFYAYDHSGLVSSLTTENMSNAVIIAYTTSYDGLERPLLVQNGYFPYTTLLNYHYDDKGTYEGSPVPLPGHGTITGNYNRGRLGYVEDQQGATFYNYDAAGRVVAVIRHDGPLSGFSTNNLTEIDFGYGAAQQLSTITYPSGNVVTYSYSGDMERPASVAITGFNVANGPIAYEPSGAVSSFNWAASSSNPRTVSRDLLSRVTEIKDVYANAVWSDVTYGYSGNGDIYSPHSETDNSSSSAHTWLLTNPGTNSASRTYVFDSTNSGDHATDAIKGWVDNGESDSLVYQTNGRRSSSTEGSLNFTFNFDATYKERLLTKSSSSTTARKATLSYANGSTDLGGLIKSIDWGSDGTIDTTINYGYFGENNSFTTSSGTYTSYYDSEMRRVKYVYPSGLVTFNRYGGGRLPLERKNLNTDGTYTVWDQVFLAGEPIAQVATRYTSNKTIAAGPSIYHLHDDRMGVVRKISTSTGSSIMRRVPDAWGYVQVGASYIDQNVDPPQNWTWQYPGQEWDSGGLLNEGWRDVIPELGQFTSPDADHATWASRFEGPQAFSYAASRPFRFIDPNGRGVFCREREDPEGQAECDAALDSDPTVPREPATPTTPKGPGGEPMPKGPGGEPINNPKPTAPNAAWFCAKHLYTCITAGVAAAVMLEQCPPKSPAPTPPLLPVPRPQSDNEAFDACLQKNCAPLAGTPAYGPCWDDCYDRYHPKLP